MTKSLAPLSSPSFASTSTKKRSFLELFKKQKGQETTTAKSPKRKINKVKLITYLFVLVMLLYPVAHFLIMWIGVNINSILLTFKTLTPYGEMVWVFESSAINDGVNDFWHVLFYNYETLFMSFSTKSTQDMFLASFIYLVLSCFVTLPIAMVFSYFVFKKIRGSAFFKIIFFIPSILPLFILCLAYTMSFNASGGILPGICQALGIDTGTFFNDLFIGTNVGDSPSIMVWIFYVWSGIGYDVILLTAAMSRIPRDILESVKMDGVSSTKEFFRIMIPLCWPTITTLFIFGMLAMCGTTFQPFFIAQGMYGTMTIGLQIYQASGGAALQTPATLGIFCSLIVAPAVLLVRAGMNSCYKNVGF